MPPYSVVKMGNIALTGFLPEALCEPQSDLGSANYLKVKRRQVLI
jgi:hypothetical protein